MADPGFLCAESTNKGFSVLPKSFNMEALLILVAPESTSCRVSGLPPAGFFVCYSWEAMELSCGQSAHSFSELGNNGTLTVMYMFDILVLPACASSFRLDGCDGAHDALEVLSNDSVPDENVASEWQLYLDVVQAETPHCEALEVQSYDAPPYQRIFTAEAQAYGSNEGVFDLPKQLPGFVQLVRNPISLEVSEHVRALIEHVRLGLDAGHSPELSVQGSGGVYFMKDECGVQNVAVFKPMDEEPMAVNNPRGYAASSMGEEGLRKGTKAGGGAFREVAAYILDHPSTGHRGKKDCEEGFAGVPTTVLVRCYHKSFTYEHFDYSEGKAKLGSLQQFVHAFASCDDVGTSRFSVEEVHKITVLDLRLANTDRHAGNILLHRKKDGAFKLVPVDHGYCLPEKFEDCAFEWLYWPQASQPYGPSALKYIEALDAEEDIKLLQQCDWAMQPACVLVLRIATMVLKKGAAAGLTPFEIGCIMSCSKAKDKKPPIEALLEQAEALRSSSSSTHASLLDCLATLLDDYILRVKESMLLLS
ncbi:hypothetical protein GOP47_0016864 [Adiantum capillus-veneris]|uniref:1-phosphatidylinositol 4-kinase n=1 Tax=Adiantum capillus-veneris TaxID=13818 RepID=A0A9D4UJ94_ADICA|nr:hypothetical protein GOP47_0016864 [Adiantum capillus-veneris]